MFNNKKDVLLESVKKIMQESELHRKLEAELNEAYGIVSRAALPHEYVAEYDAILAEAKKTLSHDQKKLAALGTVTFGKGNEKTIDTHDLRAARKGHAHKVGLEEGGQMSKGKPINTQNTPIGANLGGKRNGDKTGAVLGGKNVVKEGITSAVHKFMSKRAGAKADHAFNMGDGEEFARQVDKAEAHRVKAGGKPTKINTDPKSKFLTKESEQLEEKAVSKAQRRFFGLVSAIKKGKAEGSAKAEKAAEEMSVKQVRDYAKTKEKGLPEKKKMNESLEAIQEEIRNTLWEKLDYVYENYGEEAAMEMYASLTEEEQSILSEAIRAVPVVGDPDADRRTRPINQNLITPTIPRHELRQTGNILQTSSPGESAQDVTRKVPTPTMSRPQPPSTPSQDKLDQLARIVGPKPAFTPGADVARKFDPKSGAGEFDGVRNAPRLSPGANADRQKQPGKQPGPGPAPKPAPKYPDPDSAAETAGPRTVPPAPGEGSTPQPTPVTPAVGNQRPATPPPARAPAPAAAASAPATPQPQKTRYEPPSSGSFAGQPEWARKAFSDEK